MSKNGTLHLQGNSAPFAADTGKGRLFYDIATREFKQIDEYGVIKSFTALDSAEEFTQRTVNTGSPTAILVTDGVILFDSTSVAISISLPLASVGKVRIYLKDIGANSQMNNITINRVGADTIVDSAIGQTSTDISSDGYSGSLLSNGIDTWYLM